MEILVARARWGGSPRSSPQARYLFPRGPVFAVASETGASPGARYLFPRGPVPHFRPHPGASLIENVGYSVRRRRLLGSVNAFFLLKPVQLVKILHGCSDDCRPVRVEPPTL